MDGLIPDGIHVGLDDRAYHADPALGSSGMKRLLTDPADYWWSSPLNPACEPETDTDAKRFGKALHSCVLEGREAFESRYGPTDELGTTRAGKAELKALQAAGKIPLKRPDYSRIQVSAAFIRANPHLANAFVGGIPELSVFWTVERDGIQVRLKARLDYLKTRAITDLKSIRNPHGKPFARACRESIANYEYLLSASHYMAGRRQFKRLLAQGALFGADGGQRAFIEQCAEIESYAFVLVFYQAEGAPISMGFQVSPSNPLFDTAEASVNHAIWTYAEMSKRHGADEAWIDPQPLEELDETEMPVWWQIKQTQGN